MMLSHQKADGEFDTPSSYLSQARDLAEGGLWSLWQAAAVRRAEERKAEREEERRLAEAEEDERASKRRKGLAGAVLSTALDAAIFTGAVGYAAYQLWRGRPLHPPSVTPPPPYASVDPLPSPRGTSPPAQRKVTHIHVARPRPGGRPRTSHVGGRRSGRAERTLAQVDGALAQAQDEWRRDASFRLSPSRSSVPFDDEGSSAPNLTAEDDAAMDAAEDGNDDVIDSMQARIQSLISSGQAALDSGPPRLTDGLGLRRFEPPRSASPSGIPRPARRASGAVSSARRPARLIGADVARLGRALDETAKVADKAWWEVR